MLALQVANLISDIGDDGIAFSFYLGPLSGLELLHCKQIVPVGARSELCPPFKSHMGEVENGYVSLTFRAAGDENHRHAFGLCRLEQLARRLDCLGAAFEDPLIEAARALRQYVARTIRHETEIVGEQIRPVGQRGLVDIENKRGPLRLGRVLFDIFLRRIEHSRDVDIVVFLVILKQQILDRTEIERRQRGWRNVVRNRGRARLRSRQYRTCRKRKRHDSGGCNQQIA